MKLFVIALSLLAVVNVFASELEHVTKNKICYYMVNNYYETDGTDADEQKAMNLCFKGVFDYPYGQDSEDSVFSVYYTGKKGTVFDMECKFTFWGYSRTNAECSK